ncbi:lipopolysaccharide assembly protein LapA domain-containing protein [Pseudooceanicola sp. 200-1SW]|uniref:lipopolysaccharide assembly protein LapA domain-containing protein n=1 Tax=Pseudooceanicola sp. 200-1SW TaxID=3425949 RepID=UPI003D7F6841
MKYIRYAIWAVIAIALVAVALGNRQPVELTLLPEGLADIFAFNTGITLPLYAVIFGGIVVGLLIGFLWEWMREHKHRAEARRQSREAHKLKREVKRLKGEKHGQDEVLALLE